MEERVKSEIRYQCPACRETISVKAMTALRAAGEASIHNCLHCRREAFSNFVRVEYVDVLVWDKAGMLVYAECSFEVRRLDDADEPKSTPPAGSFEWLIAKNLKALIEGGSELIQSGPLGDLGEVRYISYHDLEAGINALLVCDYGSVEKCQVRATTVGMLCRDSFGLRTVRTGQGWVVVLEAARLEKMAERFELGQIDFAFTPGQNSVQGNLE